MKTVKVFIRNHSDALHWFVNMLFDEDPAHGDYFDVSLPVETNLQGDTTNAVQLSVFNIGLS